MAHGVREEDSHSPARVQLCSAMEADQSKSPAGAGSGRVMGSRRIFAPQFKLQVLDSYRQDADCKGNQRATARKYGIHRRQIQKWLQMESHLRSITTGSGASSPVPAPVPAPVSVPSPGTPTVSSQAPEPATALNLSCESAARLLGGPATWYLPAGGSLSGSPSGSLRGSPVGSPVASPSGSPAPQPRPSVSPTLPIKKRWCPDLETLVVEHPSSESTGSPLGTDDEDDDEDIDVDGTESEASSSPSSALDYTSATLSKRRSFSLEFKLKVLDAFHSQPLCQGNQRATARAFGINRRQVQKWLGQEVDLREEAVGRGGLNRQRLGRWMEQDQEPVQDENAVTCLDLSRKRKGDRCASTDTPEGKSDETETKKARTSEASLSPSPGYDTPLPPHLPPHPLLFRPQPLPLMPLPLISPFPMNFEMRYSLNLKMGPLDLYAHQQNLQKWDFLKHSNSAFLLNSFR